MIDILKMLCKMSMRYRAVRPLEAFYTLSAIHTLAGTEVQWLEHLSKNDNLAAPIRMTVIGASI